ncbi:uncharacterized protein V1513DRAFT_427493, partial [Lipomyces chichibuensis]|uniref:uncharacterized protein n=1 Tax=Lipomyces chichibuensis TaxID=1546026 RepID=UPI003342ED40
MAESPDYKKLWEQAELKWEQEREKTRETTFAEFIQNCLIFLSAPLQIQTNKAFSTKGSLTSPTGRICPTYLRPWSDFPHLQRQAYDSVYQLLQPSNRTPPQLFSSRIGLQGIGELLCGRRLASEADLQGYERFAVEERVHAVLAALRTIGAARDAFPLGEDIWFDNHSNTIDDDLDSARSGHNPTRRRSNADQFCVHRMDQGERTLLFTIEYKPAHKLTTEYLRSGLRPMNIWEECVQRVTIPTERDEKLKYNSELLTSLALTQVYDVMIREGLAYSCLTTGSCRVFLHVDEENPEVLYYFLAEPNLDVQSVRDLEWVRQPMTAVGRMLSLCLMSLSSPRRSQLWRNETISRSRIWEADFQHTLEQMSEEEVHSTPPGSEYVPSPSPASPPTTESRKYALRSRFRCVPDENVNCPSSDQSDSDGHDDGNDTTARRVRHSRKRNLSHISSSPAQTSPRETDTQRQRQENSPGCEPQEYCTQDCLLGLQRGGLLDETCPNVAFHRSAVASDRHLINGADFQRLLKEQLDRDLDHYCTPCGQPGAFGAPFKISLMPSGYTVIGKGATDRSWKAVSREVEVYQVLQKVQGSAVP